MGGLDPVADTTVGTVADGGSSTGLGYWIANYLLGVRRALSRCGDGTVFFLGWSRHDDVG
ncbi:hypothetical protein ABZ894_29005 [Nocardia beijingensis]|uniref:hypothetical protein n=1 Tax=Nocardia beijingensis TaxID=95162 RepID=UPI0033E00DEC